MLIVAAPPTGTVAGCAAMLSGSTSSSASTARMISPSALVPGGQTKSRQAYVATTLAVSPIGAGTVSPAKLNSRTRNPGSAAPEARS